MAKSDIIWVAGERWHDLTDEVISAGAATVVSLHGATRYLDADNDEQCRVVSVQARPMPGDETWVPLGEWGLTPCGLVAHRAHSTPLWLVVAGFVCERCWPETKLGTEVVAAVEAGA